MKSTGKGTASGKIILIGEHSVVYGQPAIALPFYATKVEILIEEAKENTMNSSYFCGKIAEAPQALSCIQGLLNKLQNHFLDSNNVQLTINSTIPAERGMGSSAAVAVALTRSYFDYCETELTEDVLLDFVNFSEKIAHGNPSGIDAAATSGTNPIYFIKNQRMDAFPLNIDAYLIVADTGIKGQTRAAVADVAKLLEQNHQSVSKQITHLGQLTDEAKKAIIENDPVKLGHIMTQSHHSLQQLSVSNAALDLLADTAINNGALGAKLTGGGRGGCLIALAADKQTAENIARAQVQQGAKKTWIQKLGCDHTGVNKP